MTPDPAPDSLAACLSALAVSAPLAQGCLDAGGGDVPGLVLARLGVDLRWAVTGQTRLAGGLGVGLAGTPLHAALAVLHQRLADSAARIRFEIHQTPASPTPHAQGAHHA